jgi:hypothetical protein
MPVKKKRAARPKKRKYTQKQKQKQKQSVNVKVSTGSGGGGGTSFIPMPTGPQFDVGQLLQGLGAIRPPPTVPAPIAEAVKEPIGGVSMGTSTEDLMPNVRASEQASMGPLQGKMSSSRAKSVSFVGEPLSASASSAPTSESESDVVFRTSNPKSAQYYRGTGFIPEGSAGKGKRVQYEEDIFGRYMPKTSDIRGSSSFEFSAPSKSKVVSMSDLMSSGGSSSAQQTGGGGGLSFAN